MIRRTVRRWRDLLRDGLFDIFIGAVLIVSFVSMGLAWQAMLRYSVVNQPVLFSAR